MKNFFKISLSGLTLFLLVFLGACDQEDVNRPVTQYQVQYLVVSHMKSKPDIIVRYFNPKYSNIVSEYYDTIKEWSFEFKGKTFDHLYLEAFTVRDSALLEVQILVNNEVVARDIDSCPWPITCDTNRAVATFTLQ
ncbi:MAG: hypothetical protein ACP5O2_03865 [Bacteroidales bacterium]